VSTYLQLCQQVHRNIRAGNNTPGSVPTTVVSQTDPLLLDIIYFVQEAWAQIQQENSKWLWMIQPAILTLPLNTSTTYVQTITLATLTAAYSTWSNIVPYTGQYPQYTLIYDPNQTPNPPLPTQMPVYWVPWKDFNGFFNRQPRTQAQPSRITEDPQYNLWLDAPPNAAPSGVAYKMACDYRTTIQVLANNTDVPLMPTRFHDLIVYWACFLYCQTRSNTAQLAGAMADNMQRILAKLKVDQTPVWTLVNDYCP
jgi:hypothetical protein